MFLFDVYICKLKEKDSQLYLVSKNKCQEWRKTFFHDVHYILLKINTVIYYKWNAK